MIASKERSFLIFFVPLFALKLLNTSADDIYFIATAITCFFIAVSGIFNERYSVSYLRLLCPILIFTVILVLTSGKTGVFFSAIFLLVLKDINPNKNIYKKCFWIGLLFLIIACYRARIGGETSRFINGDWTEITKRSNILYIAHMAIVCLYILSHRLRLKVKHIIILLIINYGMYLYVGSRTGAFCGFLLPILLLLFKIKKLCKQKSSYYLCVGTPFFCFAFSLITGILYGEYPVLILLDQYFQGRLHLENMYYNQYPITLFGQHIFEGVKGGVFWCLDSAYWDMLYNLGLVFTIVWLYCSTKAISFFYKRNKMIEVAILVMYATYGISETFLPNCFLNMSFFLYAEWMYTVFNPKYMLTINDSESRIKQYM